VELAFGQLLLFTQGAVLACVVACIKQTYIEVVGAEITHKLVYLIVGSLVLALYKYSMV
jgi:hypothetical protein